MLSPWATISYGGCRFLRVARAETVRKIRAVNKYYAEHCDDNLADTVLNVEISSDQEEYVLFRLFADGRISLVILARSLT